MSEKIIVTVQEGKIHGFKNKSSFSGTEFYSFLGVPYGQSTAGHARFKDPVAVKPWKNILNATVEKGGCLQFSPLFTRIYGSEDCLYNNIHTPRLPQNADEPLKTVIVCIHPGSYQTGTPDPSFYGSPDYIMNHDVVYVCIGFRLHILGFLNLGLPECSGNQGLKDIILSLQWIQKNISNFGGDPNNVTVLGCSNGAGLVHSLMISPRAEGLFHKGVMMGKYKYCPNVISREHNSTTAYEIAQMLGYNGAYDPRKLLSFYKKLDMKRFIFARPDRVFLKAENAPLYPISPFVTTVDYGENPVLPTLNRQRNIERTKRIPLLTGYCEKESVTGFMAPFKKLTMKNYYKSIRQNVWGWGNKLKDEQLEYIQNRIESFYLDGNSIEYAPLSVKCDIQTDIALSDLYTSVVDVIAADLPSSVYVYKFQFEGNAIKMKDFFQTTVEEHLPGTYHGDDYSYWARLKLPYKLKTESLTPETEEMVKTFTKLISTFAKTGNPNHDGIATEWKPTTVDNPYYLSINNDLRLIDGKLNGHRMEFWENLKKELETDCVEQ